MKTTRVDLSTFDGQLLDGLDFCREVYDLFDHIQKQPDGVARLRKRAGVEKKLIEELIPIARYVQARYREGRRLKVRWLSGSQSYDAELWSWGALVTHKCAPRKVLLEVTGSMHENEYLARQVLMTKGGSFGVKGISRDRKTGEVKSEPHVHTNNEIEADLATQIVARIAEKAAKNYPRNTVLIIQCFCNSLTLLTEWEDAIKRVEDAKPQIPFREVFLIENVNSYTETLYGRKPARNRRARAIGSAALSQGPTRS
jgi:hypothetical protein